MGPLWARSAISTRSSGCVVNEPKILHHAQAHVAATQSRDSYSCYCRCCVSESCMFEDQLSLFKELPTAAIYIRASSFRSEKLITETN